MFCVHNVFHNMNEESAIERLQKIAKEKNTKTYQKGESAKTWKRDICERSWQKTKKNKKNSRDKQED